MNDNQRYVLQDALMNVLKDEFATSKAFMKGRLEDALAEDVLGFRVVIGDVTCEIKMHAGTTKKSIDGSGAEFLAFLREKGMTVEVPDPSWADHVSAVGDSVVWSETGEVVPGAYVSVSESAAYPQVTAKANGKTIPKKDMMKLIREAHRVGLIGDMPLLGGTDD